MEATEAVLVFGTVSVLLCVFTVRCLAYDGISANVITTTEDA